MVTEACKRTGLARSTVYRQRQADEEFALAWADIEERTTEAMEAEARRRGMEGYEQPVFHQGEEVGRIRKYSDTLLIFMLKARKPDVYRDINVRHTGKVDVGGAGMDKRITAAVEEAFADVKLPPGFGIEDLVPPSGDDDTD